MSLGDVTALLWSPALTFLTVGGAIHRDAWLDKYGSRYRRWITSMWFAASMGCSFWGVVIVVTHPYLTCRRRYI